MKQNKMFPMLLSLTAAMLLASCGGGGNDSSTTGGSTGTSTGGESSTEPVPQPAGNTGVYSLIGADANQRTEILGALEKYAIDNMITGMPLYENGGYVMYNERVVKGTENYITGYGFGILREGYLKNDLDNPEVAKKSYYNVSDSSDPGTINALDDNGSQVSDFYNYIAGGYFGTKMNAAKNGYDWYGVLSTEDKPWVVKDGTAHFPTDPEETSATWRVYVRTGENGGVKFHNNSTNEARKAFDGRAVTLQDYLDGFKVLLCGKFAYYRGNELAKQSGYSGIAGAQAYYDATKANGLADADANFDKLGVKGGTDAKGDYLDITLGAPTNRFYAMYSLASNLYAPVNLDFFNLVTNNGESPKAFFGYSGDNTFTPVDNSLSTYAYSLESWEEEKLISFKRNDDWWEHTENASVYRIPGVAVNIFTAAKNDNNFIFNQFLNGRVDAAGIPLDYILEYQNDPRTTKTTGTSVFKLNVNSCTQDVWNSLFGDEGSVARLGDNAYECKPWMANENFIKGLFFSINRDEYAGKRGSISSINYFSSNYMSDPENGIAYNATEEHAEALEDFWGDTVTTGGYSLSLSQAAFNEAVNELLASGKVKDNDTLEIDIWWMYQYMIKSYGEDIETYFETSFNNCANAKAHKLTLQVNTLAVDVWSDVYEKKLQLGCFDLGFGSISGNALDPLNFMEVLKSDNSSGFTLNWGKDTSAIDLEYDGDLWSYNTLWGAVDHGIVAYKGVEVNPINLKVGEATYSETEGYKLSYGYSNAKADLAKLTEDVDAQKLANVPDSEYSVEILDTYFATDTVNYNGYAEFGPAGEYSDLSLDGVYYQEPYFDDETGEFLGYLTLVPGAEVPSIEEDPFVTVTGDVEYLDAKQTSVGSANLEFTIPGDVGAGFAAYEKVTVIVDAVQVINGVATQFSKSVTIPVKVAK